MSKSLIQQIWKLALPVALQSVLVSLLGMSDVFMVAGLGAGAVAAIGLGAKLHFVLIMIMASLGSAVSVLVAQNHGRGNSQASQGILALGQVSGLLLLVPFAIAFFSFPRALLELLSNDPEMIALGTQYLRYTVPLLFLTHIIIVYEAGLRSRGETMAPLILAAVAIALNIVLNYLLIHGIGPFPVLGVAGVAIASDIARLVQVLLFVVYLQRVHHLFAVSKLVASWQQARRFSVSFFKTAWPLAVNFLIWGMGTFVYHGVASLVGTDAMAALSLISPIEGLYHSLFFGLVTACAVLVGQHLGRNDFDTAKLLVKRFMILAPLGSFTLGLLLLALSPWFLGWLLEPGTELHRVAQQLMLVMCLTFWVKVFNMVVIMGALRAGGDAKYVLGADMVAMYVLSIPAVLIGAFYFELSYVWIYALVLVEEVAKAIIVGLRARKQHWVRNLSEDDVDEKPAQDSAILSA